MAQFRGRKNIPRFRKSRIESSRIFFFFFDFYSPMRECITRMKNSRDIHYFHGTVVGEKKKKRKSLRKLDEKRWMEEGEKSAVIAMTSLEIPNTCFIFVRHSLPSPFPLPARSKKRGICISKQLNGRAPSIHTHAFRAFR